MPQRAAWRAVARGLVISGTTALHLDDIARRRERAGTASGSASVARVLFLHGTPDPRAFTALLAWLERRFSLLDMAAFERLMNGHARGLDRPGVLLTFDDGFASHYDVAAPLLEQRGTRGVFFVVPGFSMQSGDAARRFYLERIRGTRWERPMTPDQIADLAARGHTIGNHTFTHALLPATAPADYEREIYDSAAVLESWIGEPVRTFAWPFVWNGITADAHRLIAARHSWCFAPCAGRIDPALDVPALLWRTSVEASTPAAELGFQCSPLADWASVWRRRHLRALLRSMSPAKALSATDRAARDAA
jgi:peptidoglycan/xylan/chitin deacetylase (PgdA/CDA1 family)